MSGGTGWTTAEPGPLEGATVWRVDLLLDDDQTRACLSALSDEERARAARFLRLEDHDRYAASHAALRHVLAGALATEAAALRFRSDAFGKPELAAPWRDRVAFNLSHSGRVGLIGLSPTRRIGVDVEFMRPMPDCLSLARSHFAPCEISALSRLPTTEIQAGFYACWTRKEAFVKAVGSGLSFPLDSFVVAVPPEPAAVLSIDGFTEAAEEWSLHHLDPAPGHVGAVVIEGRAQTCRLRDLEPGWATASR